MAIAKTFTFTCIPERPNPDNGVYRVHSSQSANPTDIQLTFGGQRGVAPQTVQAFVDAGDYVRVSYTNEDGEIYYSNVQGPFIYDA